MASVDATRSEHGAGDGSSDDLPRVGCRVRVVARVRAVEASEEGEARARADGARVTLTRRRGAERAGGGERSGTKVECVGFRGPCVGGRATQGEFYDASGIDGMIEKTLEGRASCVFAYGQTGSGKTFTMLGKRGDGGYGDAQRRSVDAADVDDAGMVIDDDDGIIPRALSRVFRAVSRARADPDPESSSIVVRVSYYEIYKEKIIDLLAESSSANAHAKQLRVRWRKREGFYIPNLTLREARSASDALALVLEGAAKRHIRAHKLNAQSSRSHAILTVHVDRTVASSTSSGKMTFVDLAGSERVKASGCDADGTSETSLINKSLFALGKVISTLADAHRDGRPRSTAHVPYRDSKLTKLLMDSLGGGALTLLVACCSPLEAHIEETVRTLQYATRAMSIVNTPEVLNTRCASVASMESSRSREEYERAIDELESENRALRGRLASNASSSRDGARHSRGRRHSNSVYHTSDVIRRVAKAEALLRSYADENARLERENDALRAERECLALERAHAARDANALRAVVSALECTFVHDE